MSFSDTSPEAEAVQFEVYRRMSVEQRIVTALEMSLFVRELAAAVIRKNHPDWSDDQVKRELLRRAFHPNPLPLGLR